MIMKQYRAIKSYRKVHESPVDTMGAGSHFNLKSDDSEDQRFRLLVSLLLSVQTNDKITDKVVRRLSEEGLSKEKVLKMKVEDLHQKIQEVNFSSKKALQIKELAPQTQEKPIPDELTNKH